MPSRFTGQTTSGVEEFDGCIIQGVITLKSTTSDKPAPESSSPTLQQGPSAQDTETTSSSADKESQPTSNTKAKKSYKGDRDRKFNFVIYGIDECEKGALRHERMNQDLQKVTTIITEAKTNLYQYVTFCNLESTVIIPSNLSQYLFDSIELLTLQWQKTENGIEGELIKIRNYKIYIQNKLQGCTWSSYEFGICPIWISTR